MPVLPQALPVHQGGGGEKGMDAEVKHVTDLKTAMRYFPMTPMLIVDGRVVHRGKRLPKKDRIAELISRTSS